MNCHTNNITKAIVYSCCYASKGLQVRWRGALPKRVGCKPCVRVFG
jgi:hypothetical protein